MISYGCTDKILQSRVPAVSSLLLSTIRLCELKLGRLMFIQKLIIPQHQGLGCITRSYWQLRRQSFNNSLLFVRLTSWQIRFLGDPTAKFTEALDLAFDGTAIFGGPRSKRYVLELEDGKVTAMHVEPDNTGLDVSAAEKVLG
jgi:hypothetical protein